uniref:Uncharacterized protein n=1 Tax=Parascaris equorum TaxID=6256 RepID=A0A914RKU5_PAREQ
MCSPSVSSHFAFSNKGGKEGEPTKFSLKEGDTRLRRVIN